MTTKPFYLSRGKDTVTMDELASYNVRNFAIATFTVQPSDYMLVCTSMGNQLVTLPSAVGREGRVFIVKKTKSTGTVTIAPQSGERIETSAAYALTGFGSVARIISDGAEWWLF